MKRILSLLSLLVLILSCSKDSVTPTPTPEPTPKYALVIAASEGGAVSTSGGTFDKGTKVTVTATPDGEYLFDSWSDGSTENPRDITVTSNLDLTANFVKKKYSLTVSIEGEGTVTEEVLVQGSVSDYNSGTKVKLTAIPNENWEFARWSGDVNSNELSIEVDILNSKSITAVFNNPYLPLSVYEFNVENPSEYKVMLQQTFYDHTGIFYYEKDGYEFIIIPGVSDAMSDILNVTTKEETPRSNAFVMNKVDGDWERPVVQDDNSRTWSIRNYKRSNEFFVLADANEIDSDWTRWGGDLVIGTPQGNSILWNVVNQTERRAFNHDVAIGDFNRDGVLDILGAMFNFFLNDSNSYVYKSAGEMISYDKDFPLAFNAYDIDNDGLDEIIFADYVQTYQSELSNSIGILKWNESESKYQQIFLTSSGSQLYTQDLGATSIKIADLDNDGLVDIIVAREGGSGRAFEIWRGLGNNQFEPYFSKFFNGTDYSFQEFDLFDADNDGDIDILLRPNLNGGNATNLFHINGRFDDGISLNNSIWINNGDATFQAYGNKELISLERAFNAVPYKGLDNKLHYFGFWQTDGDYDQNSNTMKLRMFDLIIELE